MRLKIHINRNYADAVRFCREHHMTHDGRWMLKAFTLCNEGWLRLLLVDAPKPLVIEGLAFEMYAKTNLKYAIQKLIRRVR